MQHRDRIHRTRPASGAPAVTRELAQLPHPPDPKQEPRGGPRTANGAALQEEPASPARGSPQDRGGKVRHGEGRWVSAGNSSQPATASHRDGAASRGWGSRATEHRGWNRRAQASAAVSAQDPSGPENPGHPLPLRPPLPSPGFLPSAKNEIGKPGFEGRLPPCRVDKHCYKAGLAGPCELLPSTTCHRCRGTFTDVTWAEGWARERCAQDPGSRHGGQQAEEQDLPGPPSKAEAQTRGPRLLLGENVHPPGGTGIQFQTDWGELAGTTAADCLVSLKRSGLEPTVWQRWPNDRRGPGGKTLLFPREPSPRCCGGSRALPRGGEEGFPRTLCMGGWAAVVRIIGVEMKGHPGVPASHPCLSHCGGSPASSPPSPEGGRGPGALCRRCRPSRPVSAPAALQPVLCCCAQAGAQTPAWGPCGCRARTAAKPPPAGLPQGRLCQP